MGCCARSHRFQIRYKPHGASQWTLIPSTNNEITINGLTPSTQYVWKVKSVCSKSPEIFSENSKQGRFATDLLRVSGNDVMFEVYPNPVSQTATVSFLLNVGSTVVIQILDVNGRSLKVIAQNAFSQGSHEITFNRESLSAGIYFVQLITNEGVMMKKLVIE